MIEPVDGELRDRLWRLASAVPVRATLERVTAPSVQARSFARRIALVGTIPVVAVLIGELLVGINSGRGPATTGAAVTPTHARSAEPVPGAPSASDRDGDFGLTLQAGKARYSSDEPIDVTASLTYFGADSRIVIDHDSGGPIQFGIREKVFGKIDVTPTSLLMCRRSTLDRGIPFVMPFKKGGGFSSDDPEAAKLKAWILDPVFTLPPGTWHLYAISASPCMGPAPRFSVSAEIEIIVDPPVIQTDVDPKPGQCSPPPFGGCL